MSCLIVVAHPDDEVLGAGATMYKLAQKGEKVSVCILSSNAEARAFRPETQELQSDADESMALLGVDKVYKGLFPNIQLNTVPHLQLVQFIEKAIADCAADHIITHHPSDLNNDHLHTSLACQAACRLFQRRTDAPPLKELWYMEVPSATEWGLNKGLNGFDPTVFVEVGKEGVDKKIEALSLYRGVMRDYPHPRSREALEGLAAFRGAQAGVQYAEAFQCAMRRVL
ncbi:MAG: PIG-L deacetylase family protein [Acutalibacteraceae bacterium]